MNRTVAIAMLTLAASFSGSLVQTSLAAFIQYKTIPGGNVDGEPVNALASFTTSANTITVKLENLQANPISPKSIIYDILFSVSTGQNSGTIASTMGIERTVQGGGTFTDTVLKNVVDWALVTSGANLHLDRLSGSGQPKHGIIGPPAGSGKYDAANGSIAGNGPHNPFWAGSAEFVLNVPGVTAASTITAINFSFNTEAGYTVPAELVPEPASIAMAFFGFTALICRRALRR